MSARRKKKFQFLDPEATAFLSRYLDERSPSGDEQAGQQLWRERMSLYTGTGKEQVYGSVLAMLGPEKAFKVVLAAHADEVGWMVSQIREDGYIRVKGTADTATALARAVVIHGTTGPVDAVMGWPAVHMRTEQIEPKAEDLFLDCGCRTRKEVEEIGIHVGCTAVYRDSLVWENKQSIVARALDNRLGGFILTEVARALHAGNAELPFGLYFANAVQEEVGSNGARMLVETLRPDLVLVTDVTHDITMPGVSKAKHGDIRAEDGPVLSYGPAVFGPLVQLIEEAARAEDIPFQRAAAMKSTGTDIDAFAYGDGGTCSALVSVPIKYMHTPVEWADRQTVVETCRLLLASVYRLADQFDQLKTCWRNGTLGRG